ncbi:hypothetical protein ACHAWF_014611 [Thalassiosira exigua]
MASSSSSSAKEADYYLNPTELFRWINYRRWDGAKSRAQSHPDECSTWIVSRHNTDGRILWRHLPLHLICMQREAACGVADESDVQAIVASRQMEQLMDVLLDCYPEAASSPDDQGMLPLHLLLSKAEGEPNEHMINLLLSSFPNAVDICDKFGRTPYDVLRESCGPADQMSQDPGGTGGTSDRCRAGFRALKRARYVSERITSTIRDESANIVAAVQNEASNERGASQKIIVRLEEELNKCRKEMESRDSYDHEVQQEIMRIKKNMVSLEGKLDEANRDLDVTRKERDELSVKIDNMKHHLDNHDATVEQVRREAEKNRAKDIETISHLRSEVSTSKAMTEALESQLRSRFTNEEYLSSTVSDLEEQLEELKVRHEHIIKKNEHETESLTAEIKRLKYNCDDLTKKNASQHEKLKDLNKQMSQIISSYSALSSEHDRLLEVSQNYESSFAEAVESERAKLSEHFKRQREILQKTFAEQDRIIQESVRNQDKLIADAKSYRSRGKGTVEKLRTEFQQLRAAAAERERAIHADDLAASRKLKRNIGVSQSLSARKSESESLESSSPGETRNPHPTRSQQRTQRPIHPSPSNSSTADGHLVRLLDERAAAQSTPRREQGISFSSSATETSAMPPYYRADPPLKHRNPIPTSNGRPPPMPSSIRRDHDQETPRGGGGVALANSASASSYPSRAVAPIDDYSIDQYSHESDTASGRYSSAGSSYTEEGPQRSGMERDPNPPSNIQHHRPYQSHAWRNHEHGRNLRYADEAYGDESTDQS